MPLFYLSTPRTPQCSRAAYAVRLTKVALTVMIIYALFIIIRVSIVVENGLP